MRNRRSTASRGGAVLLEVIVAVTIFSIASVVTLTRAVEARHVLSLAETSENRLDSASAFLDHVVLWPREDLDRHLGAHPQGEWMLEIQQPASPLYSIAILDPASHQKMLETVVYRAVPRANVAN